ncbi:MAG TPA: phosphoribosyltransferase family protein, partial [Candidatus Gastranaerophilaceae bacterium]|nr:phosphoribosyltransferase family protein [Candidatus Gastranaerophilaceae bacterium]
GAKPFAQDLATAMGKEIDGTVKIKSFEGTSSTGVLNFKEKNLSGIEFYDNILIIEDIVDSGRTMNLLLSKLSKEYPDKDIKICTLLDKPDARFPENKDLKLDYVGFKIKKDFVLGYGLDYYEDGRELENIYKVKFK